jgi:transcriptional regulator with XRE-family HTH domain
MDDDIRFGKRVRAVRMRLGWRQIDLAARAKVSATTVHRIENDQLAHLQVCVVREVLRQLEIELQLLARWRGGDLDRLADEGHATLVGIVARMLEAAGWQVRAEVSFYGERGSIDLLASHAPTRTLLVVEVKTSLNSVEETLRRHDAKIRLGARIARERCGWDARSAAALLALPEDEAARRRVARHAGVFGRAYPLRGREARAWLRTPDGGPRLLIFASSAGAGAARIAPRRRVRRPRTRPSGAAAA